MSKSSSARRIPPGSAGTVPITRRRQSLTVYEPTGSARTPPSISLQCSVEEWNGTDGSSGITTTFIGRSLRDAMRNLAAPTMQLCIGSTAPLVVPPDAISMASSSCPSCGPSPFLPRRMSRSHSPSAILLSTALAQAQAAAATPHFHSHHQLSANRSPSVSGASIAPGMGGRRGSERIGRLERSNSLLGGRGGGGISHLPFLPELTPQQVANLRRSWKHVNTKGLYDVIRRAFRRVESSNSNARAAFRQNDPPSPVKQTSLGSATMAVAAAPPDGTGTAQSAKFAYSFGGLASCASPPSSSTAANANQQQQNQFACGVMEHTRYFLSLLDRIIDGDQELPWMSDTRDPPMTRNDAEKELKLVGAKHVPTFELFGLGVAELERLGEAVAESFFKLDGIRQSKETTKVWRMLIAHIIDHIRDGFETELRLHRRRTSAMLAAGGGGQTVMAMAPLELRFCKRNSVPGPRNTSNNHHHPFLHHHHHPPPQPSSSSSTSAAAVVAAASASSAAASAGTFLRTELANLTRKLSNL